MTSVLLRTIVVAPARSISAPNRCNAASIEAHCWVVDGLGVPSWLSLPFALRCATIVLGGSAIEGRPASVRNRFASVKLMV